jgi:alkanesulfonate monooxygenase SsuD/methylene tetrahydromethanopterin reductase-like flavin-dependent oxidoreductase (luciferase family)
MVYLAALAQRTSTIRFAQMVFATPFHHPMRFAMDTAMIDQLSRGRECVTYDGKYWQLNNAIALPRPYQKPHPPIWFAGRSRESLEWAAANGANYGNFLLPDQDVVEGFDAYRQVCREAGYTQETMPRFYLHRSVYVAETDEQAHEQIASYLPECWKWGENKYDSIPNLGYFSGTFQRYEEIMRGMRTGIDFWLENNLAYVGSPETVIQRIREAQKLMGFNILGGRFRFGAMSDEMVMNSMRLFGEKVIPAFAEILEPVAPADD